MKKIILMAVLTVLGLTQITAQSIKSFGVKVEANMSDFIINDIKDWKSKFGIGASVAGFVKFDFGEYFAIQPEILLRLQNSDFEISGSKSDFKSFGVEVPAYAVGQLVTARGNRAYLGFGPYGRANFTAKNTTLDVNYYKDDDSLLQRFDLGCGVLLGYEFVSGLQINASYKYGFFNQLNEPLNDSFMRNQSISLGIGYRF